ncbi:MAG: hypothetical protein ACREH4_08935 [Vitreimonas sp.]
MTTLSFAAGVAGDLSAPPETGERVVVRIPPERPVETPHAATLHRLASPTASAVEVQRPPRQLRAEPETAVAPEVIVAAAKPPSEWATSEAKPDLDRAPKPENA